MRTTVSPSLILSLCVFAYRVSFSYSALKAVCVLARAGSPDGNSQQQGESSARLSPVRLGGSPMAAGSPARLKAMAQVAQQQLRCSQRAQPRPGASRPSPFPSLKNSSFRMD